MKLLTKAIINKMPLNVESAENAPIIVKFFGGSTYRFYVVEAHAMVKETLNCVKLSEMDKYEIEDIHFYGYVTGLAEDEWGETSFNELQALKFSPFGLGVERDMHFGMKHTVKQIIAKETY